MDTTTRTTIPIYSIDLGSTKRTLGTTTTLTKATSTETIEESTVLEAHSIDLSTVVVSATTIHQSFAFPTSSSLGTSDLRTSTTVDGFFVHTVTLNESSSKYTGSGTDRFSNMVPTTTHQINHSSRETDRNFEASTVITNANHESTTVGFHVHTITLTESTSTPYTGSGTDSLYETIRTLTSTSEGATSTADIVTRETSFETLSVDEEPTNEPSTSSSSVGTWHSKSILQTNSFGDSTFDHQSSETTTGEFQTNVVADTSTTVNGFHVHTVTLTESTKVPYTGSGTRSFDSMSFSSRTSGSEEGWITETTLPLYSVDLRSSASASTDIPSSATYETAASSLQSTSGLTRKSIKRQSTTTLLEIHSLEIHENDISESQIASSTSSLISHIPQTESSSSRHSGINRFLLIHRSYSNHDFIINPSFEDHDMEPTIGNLIRD
jgi:hypothetical protein